jgi:hypothetical protein
MRPIARVAPDGSGRRKTIGGPCVRHTEARNDCAEDEYVKPAPTQDFDQRDQGKQAEAAHDETVTARLAEINRRYRKRRGKYDPTTHKLAELVRLAAHRHRLGRYDINFHVVREHVMAHPRINGRQLGERVRLLWTEKCELCLRTMQASDLTVEETKGKKRERRREMQAAATRRRRRRVREQKANTSAEPTSLAWRVLGIPRSTYFRNRQPADVELHAREAAVLHVLKHNGPMTLPDLTRTVAGWHDFKALREGSRPKIVARAVTALEASGFVKTTRPAVKFVAVVVSTTRKGHLSIVTIRNRRVSVPGKTTEQWSDGRSRPLAT